MPGSEHSALIDVGGYRIWMRRTGGGDPTVVFESGGGDDSTVWAKTETELHHRSGNVRSIVYDRAGLGHSEPSVGPYRIEEEVRALEVALARSHTSGPTILVAHSYGGFISQIFAAQYPEVVGLVLVDADIPDFFDAPEVARLQARFALVRNEMEERAPKIARVVGPIMDALPETALRARSAPVPESLPVIDIVAERSWIEDPKESRALRHAHEEFVSRSRHRELVEAIGSGHYVMRDRPELVQESIDRLVAGLALGE